MKKHIYYLFLLFSPFAVLAQPSCDGIICNPLGSDDITVLIDRVINFILYLAAPIAVMMTVYAGYLFITGGEKPENVKKGAETLKWVVIGIIVLILSKSVVVFVKSFLE